MATAINMPQVGQDLETAVITEWLVKVGDEVAKGDIIAVVDSDKASFEVETFETGIVLQLLYAEGEEGRVLEPIAFIGAPGELLTDTQLPASSTLEKVNHKTPLFANRQQPIQKIHPNGKQFISPSARRVASEHQVEITSVTATGPANRIIKADVLNYLEQTKAFKATPVARNMAALEGIDLHNVTGSGPGGRIHKSDVMGSLGKKSKLLQPAEGDQVIYFDKMRKLIAERLTFSKQTIPHYYLFVEVNMDLLLAKRQELKENPGLKVSVNDMLVQVVARALRQHPYLNAHVDDEKVLIKPTINIGVAVAVENGLLVPVLTQADKLTLIQIADNTRKLVADARRGIVNSAGQGTFTISNLGMMGVKRFSAIINPPECGILTIGSIESKVVPRGKNLEIIDVMEMGLAIDHRAVDGARAAEFLTYLKKQIENYNL